MSAILTVTGVGGSRSWLATWGHSHPSASSSLELIHSKAGENATWCFTDPERGMVSNVNFSLGWERSHAMASGTSCGLELCLNVHQRVTLWMLAWDI